MGRSGIAEKVRDFVSDSTNIAFILFVLRCEVLRLKLAEFIRNDIQNFRKADPMVVI